MSNDKKSGDSPKLKLAKVESLKHALSGSIKLLRGTLGPLVALILVIVLFGILDHFFGSKAFLTGQNMRSVIVDMCIVSIAALGMTLIIISGGIDLSAGTGLALCATVLAWGIKDDIAFRMMNGSNFARASSSFDEAQQKLVIAIRNKNSDAVVYWTEKSNDRRKTLLEIAAAKLDTARLLAEDAQQEYEQAKIDLGAASSDSAQERLKKQSEYYAKRFARKTENVDLLEIKMANLGDPELIKKIIGKFQEQVLVTAHPFSFLDFQDHDDPDAVERLFRLQTIKSALDENRHSDFQTKEELGSWTQNIPNSSMSAPLALILAVVAGVVAGLVNGMLVSWLRVVPFIVTLGTMKIFFGAGNLLSGNSPIKPDLDQIPVWLDQMISTSEHALWFGLAPSGVWLIAVLAIMVALLLRYSVFGRYVFAMGSNEATARLCGVNVLANKIAVYAIAGFFFGVAGICLFSREAGGSPPSGVGLELEIIAAVVIGGGSLNGGRGSILGTLAGAAIMLFIKNGCQLISLPTAVQTIILGVIIIAAVTLDQIRRRRLAND